jgi:hypothetical protein
MTDVVVSRVRIRGAAARRLAGVAARSLPAALERSFADLDDADLGTLSVSQDMDPADHDDTTLAILWADRIRTAALAAGARLRPVATPSESDSGVPYSRAASTGAAAHLPGSLAVPGAAAPRMGLDHLVAAVLDWLDAGTPNAPVPAAFAALEVPALAAAVASRLGPSPTARLAQVLERAAGRRLL